MGNDLRKAILRYAVLRRRKARFVVLGRAAIDNLASLLASGQDISGDDSALMRIFGARVNVAVTDFSTGSTDAHLVITSGEDIVSFESPLQRFTFEESAGPARVACSVFGYHAASVVRPVGLSVLRFT